jgi:hypothetical protein
MSAPQIPIESASVADAATFADWERPSSDISNAVFQDRLADSLVDPEGARPLNSFDVDSASDERMAEEWPNGFGDEAEGVPPGGDDELLGDIEAQQQPEYVAEQEQAPDAETQAEPQSIHDGLQALDATIEQYQLNDPESAGEFTNAFCDAFGVNAVTAGVDAQALGNVMSKTALSALNVYEACGGDPSRVQPIPEEAAQAFTREFVKSWGLDPREVQVDAQGLTNTVLGGVLNFLHTYQSFNGRVTDMDQLNSADNAVHYLGGILRAFGIDAVPDRAIAIRFADACGNYLLNFLGKVQQIQQPAPKASRSSRRGGNSPSRFQSNRDIFDDEAEEMYRREHGRL